MKLIAPLVLGILAGIVALLSGCASPLPVEKYEPVCARGCLANQSQCIAAAPMAMQASCNATAENCLRTCPPKQ